jgi:hypothetical protein
MEQERLRPRWKSEMFSHQGHIHVGREAVMEMGLEPGISVSRM